ncbi:MAG TPA: preprotein translocase subunit SecG [Gemmatimonadota bacterium]|nr:preprotein translocase subunit SecG [Gemmatimonadota bacterium]
MSTLLFLLLLIDCVALMIVILLQSGKGGGLAAGFGGAGTGMEMMGSRQTVTFLHNATRWLGGAFLVICFAISILTVRGSRPRSLIESEVQAEEQQLPAETGSPTDLQEILGDESDIPAASDGPGASEGSGARDGSVETPTGAPGSTTPGAGPETTPPER